MCERAVAVGSRVVLDGGEVGGSRQRGRPMAMREEGGWGCLDSDYMFEKNTSGALWNGYRW